RAKREVFLGSCQEDVFRFALIDLLQEFPLYAAPVAQAQHSVPEEFIGRLSEFLAQRGATGKALLRELRDMLAAAPARGQHSVPAYVSYTTRPAESLAGIALRQLKDESRWVEIRDINAHALPDMQSHSYYPAGTMIKLPAAAPGNSVPQAWLDVQAERRRQVEVEGYHGFRDSHYINYELSKAARAYIEVSWHALSGGLPCKQPESWPWRDGFKWSDGRTMLVKACALGLAEIERLDRAAERGKEVGHE
ncbi:LysM peptidoglycan-binding domain-containing protein, partial [Pseudomonas aeruginosa]|uniref:LysM peptidoglycan-binding domain-containing protein n=2 Tax=Pseudomonas aeruginosa TaxID=287 RepID=UPI0039B87C9A